MYKHGARFELVRVEETFREVIDKVPMSQSPHTAPTGPHC